MRKTLSTITIALIICLGGGVTVDPAAADGAIVTEVPFFLPAVIPCTGEAVLLVGTLQDVLRLGEDGNGGFHLVGNWNVRAEGTGDFGNDYRLHYTDIWVENVTADGLPAIFNHPWTAIVVGQGGAANVKLHGDVHITVNNNGDVTSSFDDLRITCK